MQSTDLYYVRPYNYINKVARRFYGKLTDDHQYLNDIYYQLYNPVKLRTMILIFAS